VFLLIISMFSVPNCLMVVVFLFKFQMSKINMLRSCKGSVYWMAPEVKVTI